MGEFEILDTDEPVTKRIERHAYDRMIMLSDGVFAIAVTLAALELRPPEHWDGLAPSFWASAGAPLINFAISFTVIAGFWAGHRRMIARLSRVDGLFTFLNLALLGFVALLPAATAMINAGHGSLFSARLYASSIIAAGVSQMCCWAYAAFPGKLVNEETSRQLRLAILVSMSFAPVLFAAVMVIGLPHEVRHLLVFLAIVGGILATRRMLLRRVGG